MFCSQQDKYRFDSERAELPARPVDVELEGTYHLSNSNHLESMLNSSHRSLYNLANLTDNAHTNAYKESTNYVVKRDTVVKRFDLQPSLYLNGKFQNPWPDYKAPTFTNILKLGLSPDKSNVSTKQVRTIVYTILYQYDI